LLAFPPIGIDMGGDIRFDRAAIPPLGLLYLAAPLLSAGYEVTFVDFAAEGYSEAHLHQLLRGQDVVGITMLACDRQASTMIVDDVREFSPSVPIIVGGPDLTLEPRVPDKVNVAVIGEAENTIVQIVDSVLSGGDLSSCPGVRFVDQVTGEIRQGKPSIVPTDLDAIAFPARQLIDRGKYTFLGRAVTGKIASIITSRGCPFRCAYCAVRSTQEYRYRERSPENVLAEIEEIAESGYRFLYIIDNNFFVNRGRVQAIMDGILERNIKLRIIVQGRVDLVDEPLVRKMRRAGLRALSCGFESGCQETLDFYSKGTTVEQNREIIRVADRCDVYSFGNFILGAPMETGEHLQRTIDFAMQNPLDGTKFSVLWYIYGSSLWQQAFEQGLIRSEELCVLATKERRLAHFPQEEIERICYEANRGFYIRPTYWLRQIWKAVRVGRHDPYFVGVLVSGLLDLFAHGAFTRLRSTRKSGTGDGRRA